jgi:hypothetical protein
MHYIREIVQQYNRWEYEKTFQFVSKGAIISMLN